MTRQKHIPNASPSTLIKVNVLCPVILRQAIFQYDLSMYRIYKIAPALPGQVYYYPVIKKPRGSPGALSVYSSVSGVPVSQTLSPALTRAIHAPTR